MEEALDELLHILTELDQTQMNTEAKKAIALLQESRGFDSKSPDFKQHIKEALDAGSVSVTFVKVGDGQRREMLCTRNKETIGALIAAKGSPVGSFAVADSEDTIRVFSIQDKGWRSFRWESIVSFCIED